MNKRIKVALKKLSRIERVLLVAALAGCVAFVALTSRDKGSAAELNRIEAQVTDTQRRIRGFQDEDTRGLTARLRDLRAQSVTFPRKPEAEAAVVDLWNWANANNVGLARTNYSASERTAGEWQLPQHVFTVEGVGELQDILGYLQTIEGSAYRVVQIDNLTLAPAGPQIWRFTFTLNIWSQGQKKSGK